MAQVPKWAQTLNSHIWIFNVGRGLSVFIRTALNQGIIYDFGCSSSFSPARFLAKDILPHLDEYKSCRIAQTIISHPHADHISEINCVAKKKEENPLFFPSLLTCPHDETEGSAKPEAIRWERIKNPEGIEASIELYRDLFATRTLPLQTIRYESARSVPNLEYGIFYVRPPVVNQIHPDNDQDYGNGVSLTLYYRHGIHTLLIPSDITPDALKAILNEDDGLEKRYTTFDRQKSANHPDWSNQSSDQPSLRSLLMNLGLSILIAPHHGLESGYSEDLYLSMKNNKPNLVVISEKRHRSDTDGSIDSRYQTEDGASGLDVFVGDEKQKRYSVSTRNGHHILITFEGTSGYPRVFLDSDPEKLLAKIG